MLGLEGLAGCMAEAYLHAASRAGARMINQITSQKLNRAC